jgi:hypothetical protein
MLGNQGADRVTCLTFGIGVGIFDVTCFFGVFASALATMIIQWTTKPNNANLAQRGAAGAAGWVLAFRCRPRAGGLYHSLSQACVGPSLL